MAIAIRAESPNHLTNAPFTTATNEAEWINRADGAQGLCVDDWAVGPGWYEPGLWPVISVRSWYPELRKSLSRAGRLRREA
jgi:hypothetical protein